MEDRPLVLARRSHGWIFQYTLIGQIWVALPLSTPHSVTSLRNLQNLVQTSSKTREARVGDRGVSSGTSSLMPPPLLAEGRFAPSLPNEQR